MPARCSALTRKGEERQLVVAHFLLRRATTNPFRAISDKSRVVGKKAIAKKKGSQNDNRRECGTAISL
jgi:hypothetical protein